MFLVIRDENLFPLNNPPKKVKRVLGGSTDGQKGGRMRGTSREETRRWERDGWIGEEGFETKVSLRRGKWGARVNGVKQN